MDWGGVHRWCVVVGDGVGVTGRYRMVLEPSRALCGLHPREFADVFVRLAPLVEEARAQRLARPGRKRAPGAGAKPKAFGARLLVGLAHLRLGTSLRETAAIFGIDEKSVRNYRDELEVLLVGHGVVVAGRPGPVRDLGGLAEHLRAMAELADDRYVVLDGTETRRERPEGWAAQRPAWSSKTHQHVVKATTLVDEDGRPMWFEANPTGEGRTHDIAMLRNGPLLGVLALAGITVLGDLGYQGLGRWTTGDVYTPRRRRPGHGHLDRDDRLYNHALAQARIRVEHGIGHLKCWGAMRRWRRHPDAYDRTGKAVTALLSIRRAQ